MEARNSLALVDTRTEWACSRLERNSVVLHKNQTAELQKMQCLFLFPATGYRRAGGLPVALGPLITLLSTNHEDRQGRGQYVHSAVEENEAQEGSFQSVL